MTANEKVRGRFKLIINEVKKDFPTLQNISLGVRENEWKGTAGARWNLFSGFRIDINIKKLEKMNKLALKGLIAHELSHFEQMLEYNKVYFLYFIFLHYLRLHHFPNIIRQESLDKLERDADFRAVKRGYGKELIGLCKFEKSTAVSHKNKYLSISEIQEAMKKLA